MAELSASVQVPKASVRFVAPFEQMSFEILATVVFLRFSVSAYQ